jgi:glutamyl-tRNA synthetase
VGDRIVRRSDGGVLYHLAVVVDDHDMGITHVIRGADHHINTPLQLALARALGFEPPHYAHVPLIVGPGGKKLSKRRDDASIETHREQGFLPEALANWLVRLGWSHGDQEVFSLDEIRSLFDLDAVGRNPAGADRDKLLHLNQLWLRALSARARFERALPHLERAAGGPVERTAQLDQLLELVAERSQTLPDLAERARFALVDEIAVDEKAIAKHWKPAVLEPLAALHARLEAAPAWNERDIEAAFEQVCQAADMKLGKLAQPVRVAVTGTAASPGIFETLAILGRERTLARIGVALEHLRAA